MDRGRKRATGEHGREDPEKTNVSVLILQQVSLFSNWWAAAEEKMSIGLAGRCVFSFAAAGAPGPPNMADFGTRVVLPVVKTYLSDSAEDCGASCTTTNRCRAAELVELHSGAGGGAPLPLPLPCVHQDSVNGYG